MRFSPLLSMIFVFSIRSMENEPTVCGSITLGYCLRLAMGNAQERMGLLAAQQAATRGNIQQAPPEPVEVQTCRDFYTANKKKIWCCGACCCMGCTCMTATSISTIISNAKEMGAWCMN